MAGSFQPNAIHESATQMQGLRGSCLSLQDYQTLPSLPFSVAYPSQNAYIFSDNGFGLSGRTVFIKEEKGDEGSPLPRPLTSSSHHHHNHNHHHGYHGHHHHHRQQPPSRPSSDGCGSESSPLGGAPFSPNSAVSERDKGGGRTSDYDGRRGLVSGGDKGSNHLSSLMVISPPSYSDGPGSVGHPSPPVGGGGTLSSSSEVMSATGSNHHHHQQVLKYAPNGDALLSASAINYGDGSAMLHDDEDEGFDVNVGNSLGSLDDGILSGNLSVGGGSVTGGAANSFDLFEGEGEHDAYLEGDQELQLSPPPPQSTQHNFHAGNNDVFRRGGASGLHGMTTVGGVSIKLEDDGSSGRPRDNHKLSVESLGVDGGGKLKAVRPSKAASPNRAGTQTCPVCCKAFSNSSALAKHKLTHSDERKYVCQICTKAFKRQDHLNGHLLTHMNKKPYECRVDGCGKSYCDARSLRRHTENHHSGGSGASVAGTQQSAAAAAAAVIAGHVSVASALSVAPPPSARTLPPFTPANSKVADPSSVATSFLASALQQTNRIRYAPALTTSIAASSASVPTLPPPVAPLYTSACSPSVVTSGTSSNESSGGSAPSAAGHLQLLAFQQQEQQQQLGGGGSNQGSPLPWQQQTQPQQPSNSANIMYLNGPLGGQSTYADDRPASGRPSSNGGCGPPPQPPPPPPAHLASVTSTDSLDSYLGQKVPMTAHHQRNPSPTLLAQQLAKLPAHMDAAAGLRQVQLGNLFSQGNLLQTVGVPPHPLTIDLNQAIQQWGQSGNYVVTGNASNIVSSGSLGSNPKPVECNICQRKFKNIPALNGHMRLHGGYLKKEVEGARRSDKKATETAGGGGGAHHPPLQTASMSIRALIEEKIIQRRIINPPMNTSPQPPSASTLGPLLPPPPPPPPLQQQQQQQQQQQHPPSAHPSNLPLLPPPHQLSVPHHNYRSSPTTTSSPSRTVYATSLQVADVNQSGDGGSPADQMMGYGDPSSIGETEPVHLDLRLHGHHHQGQRQEHHQIQHHQPQNLKLNRTPDQQSLREQQLQHAQEEQRLRQEQLLQQQHERLLQHEQQQHERLLQLEQQQQQQQQLHRHLVQPTHLHQGQIRLSPSEQPPPPPLPLPDHHHHQQQQQQQQHQQHLHHQHHHNVFHNDHHGDDNAALMEVDTYGDGGSQGAMQQSGDAQSDMQRQIEIIKQGLMAHQPVQEKFRRHSDSDHFLLAPRRSITSGITNSDSLLVDYVQRRVAAMGSGRQRTQRTGSDPGEFTFGEFVSEFPSSLGEDLDGDQGCPGADDDVMDDDVMVGGDLPVDLPTGLPPLSEEDPFLPPSTSDMIDFESLSSTLPPTDDVSDHLCNQHLHHQVKTENDVDEAMLVDSLDVDPCDATALHVDSVAAVFADDVLTSNIGDDDKGDVSLDEHAPLDLPVSSFMPSSVIATSTSVSHPISVVTSAVATPLPPPCTGVVISRIRVENPQGGASPGDDDVFLSPTSIPTSPRAKKKKHRPEPLYIPPQVSTCGFQSRLRSPRLWDPTGSGGGGGSSTPGVGGGSGLHHHHHHHHKKIMSPPPYTPPPMLSPVRCGPGLFWHVVSGSGSLTPKSAPLTPGRLNLTLVNEYAVIQEEEVDFSEVPETDVQPHVNIGWQYQARLPPFCPDKRGYNPQIDDITWDPKVEENITEKEMEMYLQFACCAAIPGGGRNKEYALHMLCMCKGNIQEAMIKLMDPTPKLPKSHPLLNYAYAENDKWTVEEFETYQQALMNFDKDFFSIAQEIKSKSVKQCIQFYYLWKKICPDEYKRLRSIRRKREQDGTQYNLRSKLEMEAAEGESSNTPKSDDRAPSPGKSTDGVGDRFICDQPDCFASFPSRQALNGHIRIHGGNAVVKSSGGSVNGNRSQSPAAPSGTDESGAGQSSALSTNAAAASGAVKPPCDVFPCKICGKVFKKVKSRSAHMKSHRPMDHDRNKFNDKLL